MAIEKMKILGTILELSALPIQPIWSIFEVNGLNWQCCLAPKWPQDFDFFNCHGCCLFILSLKNKSKRLG